MTIRIIGRRMLLAAFVLGLFMLATLGALAGGAMASQPIQQGGVAHPQQPRLTPTLPPTLTPTCIPNILFSNNTPLILPDFSVVTSTITVTDNFTISTIEVTNIAISQSFPTDLDVFLISPGGTVVQLFTDVCGGIHWTQAETGFNLADNKLRLIGTLCPPFANSFQPEGSLGAVIGENAQGIWSLSITDDFVSHDSGILFSWGLRFGAGNCPPLTPVATISPTRTVTPTRTRTPTRTLTPTNTPTPNPQSPTPSPQLVGHVLWQGRAAQPNILQQLPITLTLKSGATEVNYPVRTTDSSGFFTVGVGSLPNSVYSWRVKGPDGVVKPLATDPPGFLSNCGTVALAGAPQTNQEMGQMRAGDSNNDDVGNVSDFNIVKTAFGKSLGDPGYDNRADFNGDTIVNVNDFNLVKQNFGSSGCAAIRPGE